MTCQQCLEQMYQATDKLKNIDSNNTTLKDACLIYTKKWNAVKQDIDNLRMQLEEIPERWQEYNKRYVDKELNMLARQNDLQLNYFSS